MIDIHSHILWSVDDGPSTLEESLVMLAAAVRTGTTDIVATPHMNPKYTFHRELVLERIAVLSEAAKGIPRIHYGCEFHLTFDNVEELMENISTYTINHKQYLLVECPDFHIGQHTEPVLRRMVDSGLVPVIAHPERNSVLRQKTARVEAWVELGCLLQVTAMSLTGGFGNAAQKACFQLLDKGLVHIVASDCHDPIRRSPHLAEARDVVSSRYGEEAAGMLFVENPRAAIEGAPIPGGRQMHFRRRTRWYNFRKSI
jgi:protein-tyrosine phosphatase